MSKIIENYYHAIVLALKDYCRKNNFQQVILGLSGGVDSALVATLAAHALRPENVRCIMLPSPYTSQISLEDAAALAKNLHVKLDTVPIEDSMQSANKSLEPVLGTLTDITAQNIQSRLRGLFLMAISNQTGVMLLTTGNKSEMAVGYSTLYGDMCGGYNPIKDLYKTDVYKMCRWINRDKEVIPQRIIDRPPSAELKPDQKDSDSLPDYVELDSILKGFIEQSLSPDEIATYGHNPATVEKVWKMLRRNEYKRFQAPPGVKLSSMSFGKDWRLPITNRF